MPLFPLLIRTPALGFRVHPDPLWLHRNLTTSAKTPFPRRSHSEIPSRCEFRGDAAQSLTGGLAGWKVGAGDHRFLYTQFAPSSEKLRSGLHVS